MPECPCWLYGQLLRPGGATLVPRGTSLGPLPTSPWQAGDAARGRYDVVVDCTGHASGFERARELVRPRGTLVLKSTFHGTQEIALSPLVVDEITRVGSRCGPFDPALRLLEQQLVDVESLLDAEYPLARGIEAFGHASIPGTLKVQVVME